jgi:hypothetical protein
VTSGVYLKDIVALWIPSKGLSVGRVTRMVTSPSLKSSYPIFEYKVTEEKKREKITICIKRLNLITRSATEWEIKSSNSKEFQWCSARSLIDVLVSVSDNIRWPLSVDLSHIIQKVPELEEMDREREKAEMLLREKEEHAIKHGSADSMMVKLLREVLDEMGVYHNKTMKKAVLVQKVKDVRKRKTAAEATTSMVRGHRGQNCEKAKSWSNYTCYNLSCFPHYYENKRKLFYNLLLVQVIFLLELIAPYLALLQYMYVAYFLHLTSINVFLLYIQVFTLLTLLFLLLLASLLLAKVNLLPFLEGTHVFDLCSQI